MVTARLYDARFGLLAEQAASVDLPPDLPVHVFDLDAVVPEIHAQPLVLSVRMTDAAGAHVSSAWYALNASRSRRAPPWPPSKRNRSTT